MGVDAQALTNDERLKYAYDLTVPTFRKRKDGQNVRRSLKDVRTEFLDAQARSVPIPEQNALTKPVLKMTKPQWLKFAVSLGVAPRTTDKHGRKKRVRPLKDIVEDCARVFRTSQPAVNGRSATVADLLPHSFHRIAIPHCGVKHVDTDGLRTDGKEGMCMTSSFSSSMTTPAAAPKMSKPQWLKLAASLGVETRTRDRRDTQWVDRLLKDIVKDCAQIFRNSLPAVNGKSATVADLFPRDVRADCVARAALPEQRLRSDRRCGMYKDEVMMWAISLGVETRKRGKNEAKIWRRVADVWSDCIRLERPPQQFMGEKRREKNIYPVRCGMDKKAVISWARSLGVQPRKRDKRGNSVFRRVQDVWSDCIRLERPSQQSTDARSLPDAGDLLDVERSLARSTCLLGDLQLAPVFDSACQSKATGQLEGLSSVQYSDELLNQKEGAKGQTTASDTDCCCQIVRVGRGPRSEVMQLAAALGIEAVRGSRAEVMQLAFDLGIETHNRDKMNVRRMRGVKEVWKDVVDLQKSCHVFGS